VHDRAVLTDAEWEKLFSFENLVNPEAIRG